jgi:hypothetical protein
MPVPVSVWMGEWKSIAAWLAEEGIRPETSAVHQIGELRVTAVRLQDQEPSSSLLLIEGAGAYSG